MINLRGIPKKQFEQPQTVRFNISNFEKANFPPPEVDRSLLIHDDVSENFSDPDSSLKEINDKDIPLEKRNIINDPTYFKQLSLSFYGTPPSPQKSSPKAENNNFNFKTSPRQLDQSLSPRSSEAYYYGFMKSPFQTFHKTMASSTKNAQLSHLSLNNSNSKLNLLRDQKTDKFEPESPKGISPADLKKYKAFRVNLNNILTTQVKNNEDSPQFSIGAATHSATTPRHTNFFSKGANKESGSPRLKKIINTKAKGVTKDYLLTEPNTSARSPKHNQVPKRLKMYALDNLSLTNFKLVVGAEAKTQTSRAGINEKIPVRPAISKGVQGIISTSNGTIINRKVIKNSYFDQRE